MCNKRESELKERKILVVATSKNIENLRKYFKEAYANEIKYSCSIGRLDARIMMKTGTVVRLVSSAGDNLRGECANYVVVDSQYIMKNKAEEIARLHYVLRLTNPVNDPIFIDFERTPFPDMLITEPIPNIARLVDR